MEKLLYQDLSEKIIGILFKVYNQLGAGLQEKYYQRAIAKELEKAKIKFDQEKIVPLLYEGEKIGNHVLDFLVDDKIVLELKAGAPYKNSHIKQTLEYLKVTKKSLALLAFFSSEGVRIKRLILSNKK